MSEEAITLDEKRKCACSPIQYAQTFSSSIYQLNYLPQYKIERKRKRNQPSEETQLDIESDAFLDKKEA